MTSLGYGTNHNRSNFIKKVTIYNQKSLNRTFKFLNLGQNIICTTDSALLISIA